MYYFNYNCLTNPLEHPILQMYKFKDFIPVESIKYNKNALHHLCESHYAIPFLEKYIYEILSDNDLCERHYAIPFLDKYIYKNLSAIEKLSHWINWYYLSANTNAIPILKKFIKNINMSSFCYNQYDLSLLEKHYTPCEIGWNYLSFNRNMNAVELLKQNLDKIDWYNLSSNPKAIHLLEQNQDKIQWKPLSSNPAAIELLKKNPEEIDWYSACKNPHFETLYKEFFFDETHIMWKLDFKTLSFNRYVISFLEKHLDKIYWNELSANTNAIHLLERNLDKVDWYYLSANPNAVPILERNLDKVDWFVLSKNPKAVPILERNLDKVDWINLSQNPSAIDILRNNMDKVEIEYLCLNPEIFELDYAFLKQRIDVFKEELIQKAMHPKRIQRWMEMMGDDFNFEKMI